MYTVSIFLFLSHSNTLHSVTRDDSVSEYVFVESHCFQFVNIIDNILSKSECIIKSNHHTLYCIAHKCFMDFLYKDIVHSSKMIRYKIQ